jgi:YaiO family outer membrane protein
MTRSLCLTPVFTMFRKSLLWPIFKGLLVITILSCLSPAVTGQAEGNDELFDRARQLAFNKQRREAREVCAVILEKNPDYFDARILLGRLHSWDGNYEIARKELQRVVEARPAYADARDALIDVEIWSDNPREALRLCDEGLGSEPNNETFHYKRARALNNLHHVDEAIAAAKKALEINPEYKEAKLMLDRLQDSETLYRAKVEYSYDAYDRTLDPWQQVSVSLSRYMPFGSLIGRINQARRFGETATQFEVDSYPRIRKGTYAYVNVGFSSSPVFPKVRYGAEVYQKLPAGFDASIGFRRLHFTSTKVMIYTGSVGKYYGNYLFQFHPFITPSSVGSSFSGNFVVRRYFEDAENYATLSFGAGTAPDQKYTSLDLIRLYSQKISLDGRKTVGKGTSVLGYFGFANQELKFGGKRKTYSFSFGIEKSF